MNKTYVSIGSGCASATLLKNRSLRNQSYPFDWILSHLQYVNDVIESLYTNNIDETVELFLNQENTSISSTFVKHGDVDVSLKYVDDFGNIHDQKFEAYQTVTHDSNLGPEYPRHPYNSKYKVTFPHDTIGEENKIKYTTRLTRLKDLILNTDKFITFVYVSPSSEDTHYTINGEPLTLEASTQLNHLCEFLISKRGNFEVVFIDSLKESVILDNKINKVNVEPFKNWFPMITKNKIEF